MRGSAVFVVMWRGFSRLCVCGRVHSWTPCLHIIYYYYYYYYLESNKLLPSSVKSTVLLAMESIVKKSCANVITLALLNTAMDLNCDFPAMFCHGFDSLLELTVSDDMISCTELVDCLTEKWLRHIKLTLFSITAYCTETSPANGFLCLSLCDLIDRVPERKR